MGYQSTIHTSLKISVHTENFREYAKKLQTIVSVVNPKERKIFFIVFLGIDKSMRRDRENGALSPGGWERFSSSLHSRGYTKF